VESSSTVLRGSQLVALPLWLLVQAGRSSGSLGRESLKSVGLRAQATVTIFSSGRESNRRVQSGSVGCGDSVPRGQSREGQRFLHLDQWINDRDGRIICLHAGLRTWHITETPSTTHRYTIESKKQSERIKSADVITGWTPSFAQVVGLARECILKLTWDWRDMRVLMILPTASLRLGSTGTNQ